MTHLARLAGKTDLPSLPGFFKRKRKEVLREDRYVENGNSNIY